MNDSLDGNTVSVELHDEYRPPTGLTGFQRDLLGAIAEHDQNRPFGKQVKHELDRYYDDVNDGRMYQNLRELIDRDFVETRPIDGRTKSYWLTEQSREQLAAYAKWIETCLRRTSIDQE